MGLARPAASWSRPLGGLRRKSCGEATPIADIGPQDEESAFGDASHRRRHTDEDKCARVSTNYQRAHR